MESSDICRGRLRTQRVRCGAWRCALVNVTFDLSHERRAMSLVANPTAPNEPQTRRVLFKLE